MKTKIFYAILLFSVFVSCTNNKSVDEVITGVDNINNRTDDTWLNQYDKLDAKEIPDNIIQLIADDWMLVTAGNDSSFNTMTASWGGMGYIWERPVSFIFIRDVRYTYEFLEKEDGFTLSFFTEEYRGALKICGNRSGRDTDKIKEAGLTPITTPSGLKTFAEARLIVECKKIYVEPLKTDMIVDKYRSELKNDFYKAEAADHTLFISEITNVWMKK